jgi:hypothetical protein
MGEQRCREISSGPVAMPAASPDTGCGKCFKFPQCRPDSVRVCFDNAFSRSSSIVTASTETDFGAEQVKS